MALIFAVDDDPQVRGLLKVLFEDQGHDVLSLESGEQCVDRLDENPSAVFLDMVMPEMDGMATRKLVSRSIGFRGAAARLKTRKSCRSGCRRRDPTPARGYIHRIRR